MVAPHVYYFESLPEPAAILAMLDAAEHSEVNCIIIGCPIDSQHSKSLAALMRQGIPIVFWVRKPSSNIQVALQEVFGNIEKPLPCLIHDQRKNAAAVQQNASHIGACISLLWNDAIRTAEFEAKIKAQSPRDIERAAS